MYGLSILTWINMELLKSGLLHWRDRGWSERGVLEIKIMEGVQLLVKRGSKPAIILGWE